jgi:aspartate/methionine/tyrosine aminotransferase
MERLIKKITPFLVMDILAKARQMPDAVHMEVGEPDLPPSENVQEAYVKAIRDQKFHYTPSTGLRELKERISDYYLNFYGVSISPERVLITPGTSGAFLVVLSLLIDEKKRLVLSDPSYPCYKNFSLFLNTEPLFVPIGSHTDYEIKPEHVERLDLPGAVLISSPANPTGNLYNAGNLKELISLSEKRGFRFISDEIYHGLVYGGKEHTALQFSDTAIVINGFSKYFCMPGYRIGWMILPDDLVRKAEIIVQNIYIAANTPAQYAALQAFDEKHLTSVRNTFRERRDFLYRELSEIFRIDVNPEGAFYIWADISRYSDDSIDFCNKLLYEKRVAVTPGIDFGRNETNHYIRFSYTRTISDLKEGVRRIKEFMEMT